ncbi:hypothetical protein B0T14DRAFT_274937 [Immersiella caudata]|uniref:Azaphilone pigments biosynthesis cluster protein L N-terminal domain-containing protein n=1 Tax=Immersiella caudata TaxID=314043 RepID=A0AA39WLR7_9PEZI|nr:hypothetical protein B0T14DRAFT_274937 [Immersiella caudata]
MDPLSIATACLALSSAVGKTSITITNFVGGCREARSDLTSISGELTQLHLVLDLLKDDAAASDGRVIPESLQLQILSIIKNCSAVIDNINTVLNKHASKAGAARWVAFGKAEVAGLRMSLEAHRGSLSLVLELVSVSVSKAILGDVAVVRSDVHDIKQDTSQIPHIMEELTRLRAIVAGGEIPSATMGRNFVLEKYLDSLASYAETVCSDVVWDSDDAGLHAPSQKSSHDKLEAQGKPEVSRLTGSHSGELAGESPIQGPGQNTSSQPPPSREHPPSQDPGKGIANSSISASGESKLRDVREHGPKRFDRPERRLDLSRGPENFSPRGGMAHGGASSDITSQIRKEEPLLASPDPSSKLSAPSSALNDFRLAKYGKDSASENDKTHHQPLTSHTIPPKRFERGKTRQAGSSSRDGKFNSASSNEQRNATSQMLLPLFRPAEIYRRYEEEKAKQSLGQGALPGSVIDQSGASRTSNVPG